MKAEQTNRLAWFAEPGDVRPTRALLERVRESLERKGFESDEA